MNIQKVRAGQGNLSLLSVRADQQYHAVQQYPEVQADQHYPAGATERERVVRHQGIEQQQLTANDNLTKVNVCFQSNRGNFINSCQYSKSTIQLLSNEPFIIWFCDKFR